jgi:hypothetical protein
MASIRKLKKEVNYLAYELLTEVFAYKHFHPEMKEQEFDKVIKEIVKSRNDIITRINHPKESKDPENLNNHFQKVKGDMLSMVKVLDKLS